MTKLPRVMITGAGSGVGQAIIKSLNISTLPLQLISADISPMNAGLYRTPESLILTPVEEESALQNILNAILDNKINIVMVGSEFDLEFFSRHKQEIESKTDSTIIASPLATVTMANDKWLTYEFLRDQGLACPSSHLPCDLADAVSIAKKWGYPIVLKTRFGTSSRHVHIVTDQERLQQVFPTVPDPMLQRLIDQPSSQLQSEYTCSVFKDASGNILGPFTSRRTVRGGTSWLIEVAPFQELYNLLNGIATSVDFIGSLNIQLMLSDSGPIPFELNCRFSGTTAVRAHFGFNEPEMAIRSFYYGETLQQPTIRTGVAIRYHEEVFIDNVSAANLSVDHLGEVNRWF